jgi:UPF0755 protein
MFLMRLSRGTTRLKTGIYQFDRGQSASTILQDIIQGRMVVLRVTVPEGFSSWQIAQRLEARGLCPAVVFNECVAKTQAEGFLFPNTYAFPGDTTAAGAIDVMRLQFKETWRRVLSRAEESGRVTRVVLSPVSSADDQFRLADGRTWTARQATTLASIIAREGQRSEELPLISAVYHNRLKKRIPLEADPTVQFALGQNAPGAWKKRLFFRDLKVDSPYNTYRHSGLPPGPICSPGEAALAAALSPAPVNSLYFVADGRGGHRFTATYRDHLKEVRERNRRRVLLKSLPL